jgi:hypothetical protein
LPITYENAIGGVKSNTNPVGRSIDSDALPQIEDPRWIDTSPLEDADPAGFGPLAPSWAPRAELIRAHDACCLKAPWFPESFDYGYFNAAPLDQQVAGYLRGDEELLFENLHRQHATYRTYLPGLWTLTLPRSSPDFGHAVD